MNRIIFTTIYDELLHRIETIKTRELDSSFLSLNSGILKAKLELKDKMGGKLDVILMNNNSLREEITKLGRPLKPEEQVNFTIYAFRKHLLFSAQDVIIFRILCSHYINNQMNGIAKISLDIIHKIYRNKAFKYEKGKDKYDEETLKAYYNSIVKLTNIKILVNFEQSNLNIAKIFKYNDISNFNSEILKIMSEISINNISKVEFSYTIGALGEYLLNSKQCGQFLPMEIYSLRFNQIDIFNMAVYISRMVIMNKRRKGEVRIFISTMLSKIMKYNKSGSNRMVTYLDYLTALEAIKRNKAIKNLETQISYILELLKSKQCINDYKISGKFQYRYIRDGELSISIKLNGKNNKGK